MPQVPPVSGSARLTAVDDAFADDGPLARGIDQFEPRAGQRRMAQEVAAVLADGGVLLAEAGTGTGKTLAYLVPAILSGHRVLVSTGTKNLQEQIYFKDLPALAETLPVKFKAAYMKGRANYVCLHRLDQARASMAEGLLDSIAGWAAGSETGDRAELEDLPDDSGIWQEIAATAETCLGSECPQYQQCFVTRMRQRAAEADVVIVNHHLLCADAAVRESSYGEVIPECAHLVLDEAHQLEDVATQYFGIAVSNFRIDELVRDVERALRGHRSRSGGRAAACRRRGSRIMAAPSSAISRWRGGCAGATARIGCASPPSGLATSSATAWGWRRHSTASKRSWPWLPAGRRPGKKRTRTP